MYQQPHVFLEMLTSLQTGSSLALSLWLARTNFHDFWFELAQAATCSQHSLQFMSVSDCSFCQVYLFSFPWNIYSFPWNIYSFPWNIYSLPWNIYSLPWNIYSFPWNIYSFPWNIYSQIKVIRRFWLPAKHCDAALLSIVLQFMWLVSWLSI